MFAENTNLNFVESTDGGKFETATPIRQTENKRLALVTLKKLNSDPSHIQQINKLIGQFCDWCETNNSKVRKDLHDLKLFCMFLNSWC